jgi:hypothetical protein
MLSARFPRDEIARVRRHSARIDDLNDSPLRMMLERKLWSGETHLFTRNPTMWGTGNSVGTRSAIELNRRKIRLEIGSPGQ